jgi:DNA-binding HxlR family transcriptional regulator
VLKVAFKTESKECAPGGEEICLCPLEGIMEIISKRWALLIIAAVGSQGKIRYNEIMGRLDGISPKSLSDRLKELKKAGLIKREAFAEIPPRVEYSLTEDGEGLLTAMAPLLEWVNKKNEKQG